MTIVNKRAILQPMLDKIELGWVIAKPDPINPCDIETECIFQHLRGHREVKIAVGNELFRLGKLDDIENLVRPAIQAAEPRSPPGLTLKVQGFGLAPQEAQFINDKNSRISS
jgi:hypothetical protein